MKSKASIKSHPIHPVIIAFPIAFFTAAFFVDIFTFGDYGLHNAAAYLTMAGIGTALLAAFFGAIDYFTVVPPKSSAKKRATNHALLNILNVVIFALALFLRTFEDVSPFIYIGLELLGMIILSVAGWMGGTLVYRNQIGVDHRYAHAGKWKEDYITPNGNRIEVGKHDDLKNDQMKLLHVGGRRIVLARSENGFSAFDDHCTHRGGSLADGSMICGTVQCPWHGSQFDVRSGEVKAGPAKEKIHTYPVNEENGKLLISLS
jgi:nitrite reductase/ring-hydroxylating ferredoxin subunit/uncharacterized membrane protein